MTTPIAPSHTENYLACRQCMIKNNWHGFLVILNDTTCRPQLLRERTVVHYLTDTLLKQKDTYTQFLLCQLFFSTWSWQTEDHKMIVGLLQPPVPNAPKLEKIAYANRLLEFSFYEKAFEFLKSHFEEGQHPKDIIKQLGANISYNMHLLTLLSWHPTSTFIYRKIVLSGDADAIRDAKAIYTGK